MLGNQLIFVTGGNGFLGSRTVRYLTQQGYRVRCLVRESSDLSRLQGLEFETFVGDIRDEASLILGSKNCNGIIHLAGISSWQKIREQAAELDDVIVEGTRRILNAALVNRIRKTVVVSSSAAINGTEGPVICDENSTYELEKSGLLYSTAKHQLEEVVRTYVREHGLDVVTVCPCETYGPSDTELVTAGNLVDILGFFPAFVCVGGTAVAHVDDVARGIVLGFEKGVEGQRYILGGDNLTLAALAKTVRRIAGRNTLVFTLPNHLVKILVELMTKLHLTPPVPKDVFAYASIYWFVDSSKAIRELGYRFRPASEVFKEVVPWLMSRKKKSRKFSLRYGGGSFDVRSSLIRLFGVLQRKKVVILNQNPKLCGEVLAASDTKGTFLEQLLATPAWSPVYSIESMDGERWQQLSHDFKLLMANLDWRKRLTPLSERYAAGLEQEIAQDPAMVVSAEVISRFVLKVLYELLFEHEISLQDEDLFYEASVEWKKEIAIKGRANAAIKTAFWSRLSALVSESRFKDGLASYAADPSAWLSIFAQPFLISPQINVGDIFVSVFHFLKADPALMKSAKLWATEQDRPRLDGILFEAIRLKHPFPILEREMTRDFHTDGHTFSKGTQIFILLDQFKQDQAFRPERWLAGAAKNEFAALPFAAGPRMCTGKPIAMELMSKLLVTLLTRIPAERIQPEVGHLFSGRNNDESTTWAETFYQLRVFARAIKRSFFLHCEPEQVIFKPEISRCPWTQATRRFRSIDAPSEAKSKPPLMGRDL